MKYYPKYKTSKELLLAVGFYDDGKTFGYVKPIENSSAGGRLHAHVYDDFNFVQIHYDVQGGKNGHITKQFHGQVKKVIRDIDEADVPVGMKLVLSPFVLTKRLFRKVKSYWPTTLES